MRKFNITVDGKNYVVDVEEIGGEVTGAPIVSAAPAAKAAPAPKAAAPAGGTPFPSPMPGLIKAIKVANGAKVKKGDVILVLEAMKMENDITSPADGVVNVLVANGANVDSQEVLFTIA